MAELSNASIDRWITRTAFFELGSAASGDDVASLLLKVRSIYLHLNSDNAGHWVVVPDAGLVTLPKETPTNFHKVSPALRTAVSDVMLIALSEQGTVRVWGVSNIDPSWFDDSILRYELDRGSERLVRGGSASIIEPFIRGMRSALAAQCYVNIRDALEHYKISKALTCSCPILEGAFHDSQRLLWINQPEETMRKSLAAHLTSFLRDAEVREEQPLDDAHPVDIKVTWSANHRIAAVEVKWVGKSVNEAGDDIGTSYTDNRAQAGAAQLAGYLDQNKKTDPSRECLGILVVFDARRLGVTSLSAAPTSAQKSHYRTQEINYPDALHEKRTDLDSPVRFFVEAA